jgi:hypothetical protein
MFGISINKLFTPTALIIIFSIVVIGFIIFLLYREYRYVHYVVLMNEIERLYSNHEVVGSTPEAYYTKDNLRFFRTAPAYKHVSKRRTISLGKVGTGYLFKPEETPEGTAIKMGTIWEGLKVILGEKHVNQFEDKVKEKLMESKVYMAVELERGIKPKKQDGSETEYPIVRETSVEASVIRDVSQIIFGNIGQMLKEREWLRDMALIGTGVALKYLAESLGMI